MSCFFFPQTYMQIFPMAFQEEDVHPYHGHNAFLPLPLLFCIRFLYLKPHSLS